MKEIKKEDKQDVSIVRQAEVEKKNIFKGSIKHIPGQTLWRYNLKSEVLDKAVVKEVVSIVGNKSVIKRSVSTEEYDQFFLALNRKNAVRKLNKVGLKVKENE